MSRDLHFNASINLILFSLFIGLYIAYLWLLHSQPIYYSLNIYYIAYLLLLLYRSFINEIKVINLLTCF